MSSSITDIQDFWGSTSSLAAVPSAATTACVASTQPAAATANLHEDEDAATLLHELQLTLNSVRSGDAAHHLVATAPSPPEPTATPVALPTSTPPQNAPHVVMSADGSCQLVGLGDVPVQLIPVMLPTGQVVMLPATMSPQSAPPPPAMPSFSPNCTFPQSPMSIPSKKPKQQQQHISVGNSSRTSISSARVPATVFPSEPLPLSPGNSITSNPTNNSMCGLLLSKGVPSPQSLGLSTAEDPVTPPEDDLSSDSGCAVEDKKRESTTTPPSDNSFNPESAAAKVAERDIGSRPNHGTNVHDALAGKLTFHAYRPGVKRPSTCVQSTPNTQTLPIFVQMFPSEWIHEALVTFQEVVSAICGPRCAIVERIEPRSETSFIAFVKTAQVWDLISALRCRALMDRHGFWYANTWQQYLDMKAYCENVRRMPQQQRHYKTDGLPCMPLVVELSRMVATESVLAPPATQVPFDTHLPMNDGTAHGARGRQHGRHRPVPSSSVVAPAVVSVASQAPQRQFAMAPPCTVSMNGVQNVMYLAASQQQQQPYGGPFSQFPPAAPFMPPPFHVMQQQQQVQQHQTPFVTLAMSQPHHTVPMHSGMRFTQPRSGVNF